MDLLSDLDMLSTHDQEVDYMLEDDVMEPVQAQQNTTLQQYGDDVFLDDAEVQEEGTAEPQHMEEDDDLIDYTLEADEDDDTLAFDAEDTTRTDFANETFITAYEEPPEVHHSPSPDNLEPGDYKEYGDEHTVVHPEQDKALYEGNTSSKSSPEPPNQTIGPQQLSHNADDDLIDYTLEEEVEQETTNRDTETEQATLEGLLPTAPAPLSGSSGAREPEITLPPDETINADLAKSQLAVSGIEADGTTALDESFNVEAGKAENGSAHDSPDQTQKDEQSQETNFPTVILNYQGYELSLFPPSDQYPSLSEFSDLPPALHNYDSASKNLDHLFAGLRKNLGHGISGDEQLELSVPALGLTIVEVSTPHWNIFKYNILTHFI
jgi:hypothetical protein